MQKTQTTCLLILTTTAIGFSLYFLKTVLLPFVLALFIVIGVRPILEFVQKKMRLPWFFAFVFTFLIGVGLMLAFAFLIWISINDLAKNSDAYQDRMSAIIVWVVDNFPSSDAEPKPADMPPVPAVDSGTANPEPVGLSPESDPTAALKEFLNWISEYVQKQMVSVASSLSSLLSYGVLILIFVFFLLLGNNATQPRVPGAVGRPVGILAEIEEQIRKYLVMKTVISLFTGFAFGLVLWIFGVPLAIVFGFLAFLLNFIPNIGPLISSMLPVPFLVLNSSMSPTSAIICFVLISTIQFVSGNVIETRIMGKSFDVSPIALLLALMFFGLVWGIVGMFLATPIVSIIKIVLQQNASTRPIANLMAGRLEVFDSYSA